MKCYIHIMQHLDEDVATVLLRTLASLRCQTRWSVQERCCDFLTAHLRVSFFFFFYICYTYHALHQAAAVKQIGEEESEFADLMSKSD